MSLDSWQKIMLESEIENCPTLIRNLVLHDIRSHLLSSVSIKKMQEKYIWIGRLETLNSCEGIELIRVTNWKIEKFKINRLIWNLTRIWKLDELRQSATDTRRPERRVTHSNKRGTFFEQSVERRPKPCTDTRPTSDLNTQTENWPALCEATWWTTVQPESYHQSLHATCPVLKIRRVSLRPLGLEARLTSALPAFVHCAWGARRGVFQRVEGRGPPIFICFSLFAHLSSWFQC